jgi:predicted enzyme related to lactoylglutathione lyase
MGEEAAGMASQMPKRGSFCWTEFACTDLSKCKPFYENVFGWNFKSSESAGNEMQYLEFSSSGEPYPDGALYEIKPEMFEGTVPPAPHIALYVSVDDVDASCEQAKSLGGTLVFGPYDIPKVGRMAVVTDPSGANISLITLQPH